MYRESYRKATENQECPNPTQDKLQLLAKYMRKMKGRSNPEKTKHHWAEVIWTALGSMLGIGVVTFLSFRYQLPLLVPSLGATAVLVYAACHVPMAQPRHVIGGHLLSALVGVIIYQIFGGDWMSIALGVTMAIVLMSITGTLHPPGGATAFIAVYTKQHWGFVFAPVGLGAIALVLVALLVNNFSKQRSYPHYW